ncbi:MAG: aldolase [Ignavibacteriales bacterium]
MKDSLLNNEHINTINSLAQDDEIKLRFSNIRYPIHTFYGGAHLFKRDTFEKIKRIAQGIFNDYCEESERFYSIFTLPDSPVSKSTAEKVYHKIHKKVEDEPVEDYRIDFEDGYGYRSDEEEDEHAISAATETAEIIKNDALPSIFGIRIKPIAPGTAQRAVRTLDLYINTLLKLTENTLPPAFVVTLPKVTRPEQLSVLNDILHKLEMRNHLPKNSILTEVMIETPEAIAEKYMAEIVQVGGNRLLGGHLGVYDLNSSFGVSASFQEMQHPSCDYARVLMKIILGRSGIRCVDGVTNVMPVAPNKATLAAPLAVHLHEENVATVIAGWQKSYSDIRHSLRMGFYQGWDLHPAQIISRLAAVYIFFLNEYPLAAKRMKQFLKNLAQPSVHKGIFDDAASGFGLLLFFRYGFECHAFDEHDLAGAGITKENLYARHFSDIISSSAQ